MRKSILGILSVALCVATMVGGCGVEDNDTSQTESSLGSTQSVEQESSKEESSLTESSEAEPETSEGEEKIPLVYGAELTEYFYGGNNGKTLCVNLQATVETTGYTNGTVIGNNCHDREKVRLFREKYPDAKVLAHPECKSGVLALADFIGSTAAILTYAQQSDAKEFVVATESGILHEMQKRCPDKVFLPVPPSTGPCACNECGYMRLNTLEKLYNTLKYEWPTVELNEELREAAKKPIVRMLELSK